MRLAKLTGLEIEKLEAELKEVRAFIEGPARPARVPGAPHDAAQDGELQAIAAKYGDERRSEITSDEGEFTIEDLIADEEMVVTISHSGYIKRTSVSTYKKQRRGGRGLSGQTLKDEDFIEHLFIAEHARIPARLHGRRALLLAARPRNPAGGARGQGQAGRQPHQRHAGHEGPVHRAGARVPRQQFLLFSTKKGTVKKTALSQLSNPRANGIKAIKIEEADELMDVQITSGTNDIVLATRHGLSIRFHEQDVREMGRDTTGVKGIEFRTADESSAWWSSSARRLCWSSPSAASASARRSTTTACSARGKGIITIHRTGEDGRRGFDHGSAAGRRADADRPKWCNPSVLPRGSNQGKQDVSRSSLVKISITGDAGAVARVIPFLTDELRRGTNMCCSRHLNKSSTPDAQCD